MIMPEQISPAAAFLKPLDSRYGAIVRIWRYFSENDPRILAVVAHFTSDLVGGAGIATQRLHFALSKAGVNSSLYFGQAEPLAATTVPAIQNRTSFWTH